MHRGRCKSGVKGVSPAVFTARVRMMNSMYALQVVNTLHIFRGRSR